MNSITNTNSIDPRVLKELLQLQTLSKLSLFSDDTTSSSSDDTSDFGELLNTLMGQGVGTGTVTDALDTSAFQQSLSNLPSALGALNKSYTPLQSISQVTSVSQFEGLIGQASQKYGVDSALVKAVIQQESSFNHQAVSSAGAKG